MQKKKKELKILQEKCTKCKACELHKTRNNVVFSDGDSETARVILIGEAPGETEDLTGKPFVGRAGKLLSEFLESASLDRKKDLFIINTIKCRPPKNRVPTAEEKALCEHFLIDQIDIINPEIILLCGATALKSFSKNQPWAKTAISKIRGEILEIEIKGKKYKAMAIFHPSYLLRNHSKEPSSPRGLMLRDLKEVKNLLV